MLDEEQEAAVIAAALSSARNQVFQRHRTAYAQWRHRQERHAQTLLLADNFYSEVIRRGQRVVPDGRFQVSGYYRDVLEALSLYFTNDPRFNQLLDSDGNPYSLQKGLLLRGPVGCRKTSLLRLCSANPTDPFGFTTSADVVADYRRPADQGGGEPALTYWKEYNEKGMLFDDLGAEAAEAKSYGNSAAPLLEVLLARYVAMTRRRLSGRATHLTTNLTLAEINARYGERTESRFREMFNVFSFPDNDPDYRR